MGSAIRPTVCALRADVPWAIAALLAATTPACGTARLHSATHLPPRRFSHREGVRLGLLERCSEDRLLVERSLQPPLVESLRTAPRSRRAPQCGAPLSFRCGKSGAPRLSAWIAGPRPDSSAALPCGISTATEPQRMPSRRKLYKKAPRHR
jgi:hypothetical protein